jgi:ATP-binding cassette, subfamily B, bacterial
MLQIWRKLVPLLPAHSGLRVALQSVESVIAGLLEAALLVLVVQGALALTEGLDAVPLSLPVAGGVTLSVGSALACAAVAGVVMLGIHLHVARFGASISATALHAARERVIDAYADASWEQKSKVGEGALQEAVSTLAFHASGLIMSIVNFVAATTGLAAVLVGAVVVDPLITLIVVVFGSLMFLALRPLAIVVRRRSRALVDDSTSFSERMSQWSTATMDLRSYGTERAEARHMTQASTGVSRALATVRALSRASGSLYRDVAILFMVAAVVALREAGDSVDFAAVGAVVLLVVRALSYAQAANAATQQINEAAPNLDVLIERISVLEASTETFGSAVVDRFERMTLKEVGYEYEPNRGVQNLNLTIEAGEAVGVIGPSGGGKSTLVQLLLRLRRPTSGTIEVNGMPLIEVAPTSWHRLVALVPQEPKMLQDSVTGNIRFLREDISDEDIIEAAELAHIADEVRLLPAGFSTMLGPRGAGLSGGQKQRITIARALAGKPQLLVLDEPTSALDLKSEEMLQQTVEGLKGKVTMVIVAHRLSTLVSCDRVVAMEGGRIKTVGDLGEALAGLAFEPDDV